MDTVENVLSGNHGHRDNVTTKHNERIDSACKQQRATKRKRDTHDKLIDVLFVQVRALMLS